MHSSFITDEDHTKINHQPQDRRMRNATMAIKPRFQSFLRCLKRSCALKSFLFVSHSSESILNVSFSARKHYSLRILSNTASLFGKFADKRISLFFVPFQYCEGPLQLLSSFHIAHDNSYCRRKANITRDGYSIS